MILGMRNIVKNPPPINCQVNYIESDGASWINTYITPNQYIVADFEFSFKKLPTGTRVIYGTYYDRATHPQIQVVLRDGIYIEPQTWCDITGINFYETIVPRKKYHITVTSKQTSSTNAPFYIMARNNDINNFLSPEYMRLHSLCMKNRDSGEILENMVPWVDDKGEPCMKNTRNEFYYNKGTGKFTVGTAV